MRLVALLLLSVSVMTPPAGRAEEAQHIPPSRNAVWREIFARPRLASLTDREAEQAALGYDLFRDKRLSGDGKAACATCHDPARDFTDGRAKGEGPHGAHLARNVPSLFNLAWSKAFFWDGRAASLADQARFPIEAPDELGADFAAIVARLSGDAATATKFARSYPDRPHVSEQSVLEALAAYERTLVSATTPFDRWVEGDDAALTPLQQQGFDIFVGKGGCVACHGGWRFTDDAFHDIGLKSDDPGRGAVSGGTPGLAEFKTPSLRELRWTAPYMHDGSMTTLDDVVDHYAGKFVKRPSLATNIVRDLSLTANEKEALVAFLKALSSDRYAQENTETTRPMPKK